MLPIRRRLCRSPTLGLLAAAWLTVAAIGPTVAAAPAAAPAAVPLPAPTPRPAPAAAPVDNEEDDSPQLVPPAQLTRDTLKLTSLIYDRLAETRGNVAFAPFDVAQCLGLAAAGAQGEVLAAIRQAMQWQVAAADLPLGFHDVSMELRQNAGFALGAAAMHKYPLPFSEFFKVETLSSAAAIAPWIAGKTTSELLRGDVFKGSGSALLTSTTFQANWGGDQRNVGRERSYKTRTGARINTRTLNTTARLRYVETRQFQVVELIYQKSHLSLVILLPRGDDISLTTAPSADALREMMAQLEPTKLKISLPVFTVHVTYDLTSVLAALHMAPALSPRAELTGWGPAGRGLKMQSLVQRVHIGVDEHSTSFDAVTMLRLQETQPKIVPNHPGKLLERPFLFLLRDTIWGLPLAFGRVEATP